MKSNFDIQIRPEREEDYLQIRELVEEAFARADHSDGDEQNLIERIRQAPEYIPELSLVAVSGAAVLGHVMLSRITIGQADAVALAPLAVIPSRQREGIGKLLVDAGHAQARKMRYACSVVLGDPRYYSRFGYEMASRFGIIPPFDVPEGYYMACILGRCGSVPKGCVKYSKAFGL
ncbi:MAG: N-acetyltransferase [Muribaculaceae bacterium]|nr:N-acetyltransferase [Muribaculaceae bacterium]